MQTVSKQIDYTGQILDNRYRVVKRLASGGMGSIYLGQHVAVGRKVAVKFLHENLTEKDDMVMRFFREAQAAAAVRHKNIIDVWDMGTSEQGEPFLVMEYLEGESLADLLKRTGPMDLPAACAVLEQMLLALGAAHEKGIVHRDLKPDNIFLAWILGEALPVVKIIDFGVSKLSLTGTTKMTVTGTQFGTPSYMAPEQIRGDDSLDHRADLYSVGVVMYKMLTGKLPFTGQNNLAVFAKALTEDPIPLEEAYKNAPVEASPMVMRLLQKNAKERYASAAAVIEEMKSYAGFAGRFEALAQVTSGVSEKTFAGGDLGELSSEIEGQGMTSNPPSNPLMRTTPTGWAKNPTQPTPTRTRLFIAAAGVLVVVLGIGIAVGFAVRSSVPSAGTNPAATSDRSPAGMNPAATSDRSFAGTNPAATSDKSPAGINPAATAANPEPSPTKPEEAVVPANSLKPPAVEKPPIPETVTLRVEGAPKGAAIFFNDTRYETTSFSVEKSAGKGTLRIVADGYKDFEVSVTPDADQPIVVHLESTAPVEKREKDRPDPKGEKKHDVSLKQEPKKPNIPGEFKSDW